jgi:hypothetical protein
MAAASIITHGQRLIDAATSQDRVKGLTHDFYRYPARFPPNLIRELIEQFSSVGDFVIDPFVGGGTTAVEARILGRRFLGCDINSLAAFVSIAKTTPLSNEEVEELKTWVSEIDERLNLRNPTAFSEEWKHYHKNLDDKQTWPIRKSIQLALDSLNGFTSNQEKFLRCCVLNASQRLLDAKKRIPTAPEFRAKLAATSTGMLDQISDYSIRVRDADAQWDAGNTPRTQILNRSVIGIERVSTARDLGPPKLIITSPPYPGVHVLYHRWQILGRRETPAPYWIANALDGNGAKFYTFGGRHDQTLERYFANAYESFRSLAMISGPETHIVQVVGFSEPAWQLPLYLETMEEAGLVECKFDSIANHEDGRLWRDVPNRKWFASQKGATHGSKEVVLVHRLPAAR